MCKPVFAALRQELLPVGYPLPALFFWDMPRMEDEPRSGCRRPGLSELAVSGADSGRLGSLLMGPPNPIPAGCQDVSAAAGDNI